MNKLLMPILGIVGIIVVFYMFPSLLTSLDDLKTDEYTETFTNVTTAAGDTNASVTLSLDLYRDSITRVDSITSDNGSDSPSSEGYVDATDALYVKGLAADSSRNLTIIYDIDNLADYEGLSEFSGLTPLLLIIGALGLVLVSVWKTFTSRR